MTLLTEIKYSGLTYFFNIIFSIFFNFKCLTSIEILKMKQVYQKKLLINYGQQMKVMITIHI